MVVRLGKLCQAKLTGDFTDEPVGSFEVDSKLHPRLVMEIERGLLIGAFIAVSRTPHDPVGYARGSRIRLSLMLAPHFGLLLRNYRWISLSTAIGTVQSRETPLLDQEEE
jgi:hypothetical protein